MSAAVTKSRAGKWKKNCRTRGKYLPSARNQFIKAFSKNAACKYLQGTCEKTIIMNTFLKPSALAVVGLLTLGPLSFIGFNSQTAPLRYVAVQPAHAQDAEPPTEAKPDLTPAQLSEAAYTMLETNCSNCHGPGKRLNKIVATDRASYDRLVNEQEKVVPGKPDESELYLRMIDHEKPMPPKKAEPKPSEADIEAVRLWIEKGAPAPAAEAPAAEAPAAEAPAAEAPAE